MRLAATISLTVVISGIAACSTDVATHVPATSTLSSASAPNRSWGPETPPFNLEVVLRGTEGFGLVKFRQPNDDASIIDLDTWVRGLAPNTSYVLQRAAETNLDGVCTSTAWLTLGKGLVPQALTTDATGSAREALWRSVASLPVGSSYDIQFRVVNVATSDVVLTSDCYRYTISL